MHPLIEEEDGGNLPGEREDFSGVGPDSTAESSMFSLNSPAAMVGSGSGGTGGFNFHQSASETDNTDVALPSVPEIPLPTLHGETWMSSIPHNFSSTEAFGEQERPSRAEEMVDRELEAGTDSLNLDMFSSVIVVPETSSAALPDAIPPSSVSSSLQSDCISSSSSAHVSAATVPAHPLFSSTVTTATASTSSSRISSLPAAQTTKASQTTTPTVAVPSSPTSFASATSHTKQNAVKSSALLSSSRVETVPPIQSSATSSTQPQAPPSLPTSPPPALPAIARIVQDEPAQHPQSEPVISIQSAPSNGFSGSGGSVPTNSWNVVAIPDFTDSLPRAALQEDDIEQLMDLDVSSSSCHCYDNLLVIKIRCLVHF